jgi:hypothetical protein
MTPLAICSVVNRPRLNSFLLASTWRLLRRLLSTYPNYRVRQRPGGEDNIEGVSMRHNSVRLVY